MNHSRIHRLSRRDFLASTFALPAVTCVRVLASTGSQSPLAPYLALQEFIQPGYHGFAEEKEAMDIQRALHEAVRTLRLPLAAGAAGSSPMPKSFAAIAPDLSVAVFDQADTNIAAGWSQWVRSLDNIRRIQFDALPGSLVRFEVATERPGRVAHRTGVWRQTWSAGQITSFTPVEEHIASASDRWFRDITAAAFEDVPSFAAQLSNGVPYWRSRLDPASGIDIYGSNGIAVGDIDSDGQDEIFICQPGGLPNRLYKFTSNGRLTDIANTWNVGLLDDTSAALFLDLRNTGRQDLVVLRSGGPVLYINEGSRFTLRTDAFQFATSPKGGFTGMAAADFDRDGRLDLYLCCYVYFQSEAQFTYAAPYHDARNGPPNFLFRNRLNADGTGSFIDSTDETGLNENNNRFSFAPGWCDFNGDGWPDLYVANDFGRKNLYLNKDGRFTDVAAQAGVEDIGPGMSAAWFDYDHDGRPDLYVGNMWSASGQRVVIDPKFAPVQNGAPKDAYRRHAKGNSLYRNRGNNTFEDTTEAQHVAFGRWAWSSGGHDLDNDGHPEIFITCGMLTNQSETDLMSFFWREVVDKSPVKAESSTAYQDGWNALNQFAREEYSWNGREPNVLHARRTVSDTNVSEARYFDFSGVSGLDFADDSRAFAITDCDGDGRPDIILKSRLGPQVRVLQNNCARSNRAIAFRLVGTKSNRDAIGARIRVDGQTKWLDAGCGFLSQHSKTIIFGLGERPHAKKVEITWPSGLTSTLEDLEAGYTCTVIEGQAGTSTVPFRSEKQLPCRPVESDNSLALEDTWFLEAIPLPEPIRGPGLFVLKDLEGDRLRQYEVFRRYLFDWRTSLKLPIAFLLNEFGEAVKLYANVPPEAQVAADRARIGQHAALALPFSGDYVGQPHRDFFKFGAALLWAGYPDQSLSYLEKVLQRSPENARVVVLVGQIHLARERFAQAEKYFRMALDSDPKSPEAAYGYGLCLAKQNQLDKAKPLFERAISNRPDYADAINDLGALYIQQGQTKDAIAAFQYGIRVAPNEDILYLNLGRIYARMGQLDRAREVMQTLVDRKPDSTVARQALQELSLK